MASHRRFAKRLTLLRRSGAVAPRRETDVTEHESRLHRHRRRRRYGRRRPPALRARKATASRCSHALKSLAEIGAAIPGTVAFPTDVTDEPALRATCRSASATSSVRRASWCNNAATRASATWMNVDSEKFEQAWRINTQALFVRAGGRA